MHPRRSQDLGRKADTRVVRNARGRDYRHLGDSDVTLYAGRVPNNLTIENLLAEVLQTVGFLEEDSPSGAPSEATPLRDLGFDSLAGLELGIVLEEIYEISINVGAFSLQPTTSTTDLWAFINR